MGFFSPILFLPKECGCSSLSRVNICSTRTHRREGRQPGEVLGGGYPARPARPPPGCPPLALPAVPPPRRPGPAPPRRPLPPFPPSSRLSRHRQQSERLVIAPPPAGTGGTRCRAEREGAGAPELALTGLPRDGRGQSAPASRCPFPPPTSAAAGAPPHLLSSPAHGLSVPAAPQLS